MLKILIFSIFLRLLTIFFSKNISNYDLSSYKKIGDLTLQKTNIYPQVSQSHYPYFPFYLYFQALAVFFNNRFRINYIFFLKFINLIFDLLTIYLIYLLSGKNLKIVFYYAINPISILIFYLHGQFDVIPLFFILLSFYLLKQKTELLSVLSYSLAILIKPWPILFVFSLFRFLENKLLFLLIPFFPLLFTFVYVLRFKSDFFSIVKTILTYPSIFDFFGLGKILSLLFSLKDSVIPNFFKRILLYYFLSIFFFYSLKIDHCSLLDCFFSSLLFFYTFNFGFSIQYFSWFIPFLFLSSVKSQLFLYLITFLNVFFNYLTLVINSFPVSIVNFFNVLNWITFLFFTIFL